MKTLWMVMSVMAIANILGLAAFVGWLGVSGRLDRSRVEAVRMLFVETIEEQAIRETEEAREREALASEQGDAAAAALVPVTASEALSRRVEVAEVDLQRIERLKREVEDLQRSLRRERAELDRQQQVLIEDRTAFDTMRKTLAEIEGGTQFKKALSVLQTLKAPDAKAALTEIIAGAGGDLLPDDADDAGDPGAVADGAGVTGMDRAVSYLNAMEDRVRAKVMAEFIKEDPRLAAELLERVRTRGLIARAEQTP